jgi:DNA helicase II / ATP-dependent DNA helicase PcrA
MTHDYLVDLNQEQRRAVKHGVKDGSALEARPLLVIAGAGSGKTKTLAHRVASSATARHLPSSLIST